ncbi:MAG: hypothetical protein WBV82_23790 [Myxococcaceae bacterium]
MEHPQPPRRLPNPPGLRFAGLLVVLITAFMGVGATMDTAEIWNLSETRRALDDVGDPFSQIRDALKQYDPEGVFPRLFAPEVVRATVERQLDALEQMRGPRTFALMVLSTACMFAFVAAGRLLRTDGMPREGMRRILVGSLLVAAFLRTFVGAQTAAVNQKVMRKMPELVGAVNDVAAEQLQQYMLANVLLPGLWTALMAGFLVLLGQYFRSEKIKQVVALQDQHLRP